MSSFVRRLSSGVLVLSVVLGLSGCVTKSLSGDISIDENRSTLYSNDVITAATVTQSGKADYKWVFIGNHFDYALTSGADDFLRALVTGKIEQSRVSVSKNGVFLLNKDKKQFSGDISLTYRYQDKTERDQIIQILNLRYGSCSQTSGESGVCEINLTDIKGTIHKKATVPADVFRFNHPIKVNFYTQNGLSAKRALYPVAVAADVVMSPLYLLGAVAGFSIMGLIIMAH